MTSEDQNNKGTSKWTAMTMRFLGFVFVPSFLIVVLGAVIGHAPWLGYALIVMILGVIIFPAFQNHYFGYTRNFPRILILVSLFPSLVLATAVFVVENKNASVANQSAGPAAVPKPATASAAPAVKATASVATAEVRPVEKAKTEKLSWSGNFFRNDTSRVVLAATTSCTAYFNNSKVAGTVESTLDFTDSAVGVPILPGESRKHRPEFKFNGSRDDVNERATRCEVTDVKYAEPDEDVPIGIRLGSKKSAYYGDYKAVATLTNQSARKLSIKKLKLACVIRNDRAQTSEEMMDAMKYGVYEDDDMVHVASYYGNLIAKPLSSSGETQVDIPAGKSEEVRLYKEGGMFSSDEELGIGDFTKYQCWVLD